MNIEHWTPIAWMVCNSLLAMIITIFEEKKKLNFFLALATESERRENVSSLQHFPYVSYVMLRCLQNWVKKHWNWIRIAGVFFFRSIQFRSFHCKKKESHIYLLVWKAIENHLQSNRTSTKCTYFDSTIKIVHLNSIIIWFECK